MSEMPGERYGLRDHAKRLTVPNAGMSEMPTSIATIGRKPATTQAQQP